jgi:hypothetical protein
MYASQTLVGAHASKLVGLAEAALKAAKTGAGEQEWLEFLEAFHRHAYFLGALRGAGSEVGRALRTLQMVQKVGAKTAARNVKGRQGSAKTKERPPRRLQGARTLATDSVSKMADPAERTCSSASSSTSRRRPRRPLAVHPGEGRAPARRLDAALGNSAATSSRPHGRHERPLSASPSWASTASMEPRLAQVDGLSPFGGPTPRPRVSRRWSPGPTSTDPRRLARRDGRTRCRSSSAKGMEEVVLNAEAWGAKGLAPRPQGSPRRPAGRQGQLRARRHQQPRASLLMSSVRYALPQRDIESWNTPKLMEHSLKWLLKAMAGPHQRGRLGLPARDDPVRQRADQFIGTSRPAPAPRRKPCGSLAHEAAELQLEGKPSGDYMKARMVQLTETVDGFADDAYSAGQQEAALAAGEVEAKGALFQDPLETAQPAAMRTAWRTRRSSTSRPVREDPAPHPRAHRHRLHAPRSPQGPRQGRHHGRRRSPG